MNIKEKFNTLALIGVLSNFLTFLMTDKSTNSIMVLIIGLVATIGYAYYANKKYVGGYESLTIKVDDEINELEEKYSSLNGVVGNITGATDEEKEKLVEINATLENTSDMVLHNKENTRQASVLAESAIDAAKKGTEDMQEMMGSIIEIKNLSAEIEKIIKVIDDIAFQTNILALNAAVEAARAGEAGKGFAVVADEVRNLAQKSAEAAKNTNVIIEKNIKTAVNSVKVSEKVNTSLDEINEAIHKVSELINEITASSEEQADEVISTKNHIKDLNQIVERMSNLKDDCISKNIEIKDCFEETLQNMKVLKGEIEERSLVNYENIEVLTNKVDIIKENTLTKTSDVNASLDLKEDKNKVIEKSGIDNEANSEVKNITETNDVKVSKSVELKKIDQIVKENQETTREKDNLTSKVAVKNISLEEKVISEAERILPLDDSDGF